MSSPHLVKKKYEEEGEEKEGEKDEVKKKYGDVDEAERGDEEERTKFS